MKRRVLTAIRFRESRLLKRDALTYGEDGLGVAHRVAVCH